MKSSQPKFDDLGVIIMRKRCSIQQGITVDQSKVLKNLLYRLFRFLWATRYIFLPFTKNNAFERLPLKTYHLQEKPIKPNIFQQICIKIVIWTLMNTQNIEILNPHSTNPCKPCWHTTHLHAYGNERVNHLKLEMKVFVLRMQEKHQKTSLKTNICVIVTLLWYRRKEINLHACSNGDVQKAFTNYNIILCQNAFAIIKVVVKHTHTQKRRKKTTFKK